MYTATLRCGSVLAYGALSFVPRIGEYVPCMRHGYCVVDRTAGDEEGGRRPGTQRARPRAQDELLEWLRVCSVTTVHALRRRGFTLRMVAFAERQGLVAVDLEAGTVTVR